MNKKQFLATTLALVLLLLLTSCNSVNNDTLTLADKVADEFGRTPANMLKKINKCAGVGRSNCYVAIYFTTPKNRTTLAPAALKVGLSERGEGGTLPVIFLKLSNVLRGV